MCIAACRKPPPAPAPKAVPHAPTSPLAFRFVDHAGEARVDGTDLEQSWRAIPDHPQRSLLPYRPSGQPPAVAFRAVEMAFADSDVEDYPRSPSARAVAHPVRDFDPVWNRTRAVYLSRETLYVPAGASQSFRVRIPDGAYLETAIGLLAPARRTARFRVAVDGQPLLDQATGATGTWRPARLDLAKFAGREATISFAVIGDPGAHGFFADPLLYGRATDERPPNVLFVVIDTLRADALPVMPRLRALAARSASFEQAITAATWTRPSLLAMYGGDLPTAVGQSAERMIPDEADRRRFYRLAPALLPRLLEARGYRASSIGNNFFLLGYPAIGLDLGFEEVDDVRHPVLDTPAITRAAIRYLDENRDHPFLLHLHYDAPHWPYTPPPEYLAPSKVAAWRGDPALRQDRQFLRYLAEAVYADDYLGRVLDELDRLGLAERTIVVVVGDHGEVFDPAHDQTVVALGQPTLHHHGWSAWDELLRVPLVIGWAGHVAPTRVTAQVRLTDLSPTLLDYLGFAGAMSGRGRSLRPLIEGREREDRVAFVEGQDVRAVRADGWAYLRRRDGRLIVKGRARTVDEELYDLRADPAEHDNLVGRAPEELARMRALFAREAPVPPEPPSLVYHLRVAPDERAHVVEGSLAVDGRLALRSVSGGEVGPGADRALAVRLRGGGGIDFAVDPPEAPLHVALTVDGVPLETGRLLVGEYAIPVVDGPLEGALLARLDARRPPTLGERGGVFLYREPGALALDAPRAAAAAAASDEVTDMMRRWGYAQPTPAK